MRDVEKTKKKLAKYFQEKYKFIYKETRNLKKNGN